MYELKFESSAVHIALATYPIGDEKKFHDHIDSIYVDFIKKQRKLNPKGVHRSNIYFYPYRYHMFGHYNVAYISLIDNYKFAQRVFTSTRFPQNTFSYQIQTGSLLDTLPYSMLIKKGIASYFSKKKSSGQTISGELLNSPIIATYIQKGIDFFVPHNSFSDQTQTGSLLDKLTVIDLIRQGYDSCSPGKPFPFPIPDDPSLNKFLLKRWIKIGIDSIYSENPYLQITNFKLSNGLLIGTGADFKILVISKIRSILMREISGCVHILLNSFNWSDITLILISSKPKLPFDIIYELRNLSYKDLFEDVDSARDSDLLNNTLYKSVFNFSSENILNTHVFVDTHSYYGFALNAFTKPGSSSKFLKNEFKAIIEIEEKPGHLSSFVKSLIEDELISDSIMNKIGKTDYILQQKAKVNDPSSIHDKLQSNYEIFHHIENNHLSDHIRRIKTTPVFKLSEAQVKHTLLRPGVCNVTKELNKLISEDEKEINLALKKLNLSRQLRTKIRKVFHSYKIGISDSILFIYFIDFIPFINYLKSFIIKKRDQIDKLIKAGAYPVLGDADGLDVNRIESNFDSILKAFEEAYDDRILNNYQFEDINDYSIDFNTSLTQIISTTDSLIKMISPSLFEPDGKLLIRQNELNTVSNVISINYNVFHLLEPPFVINTIVKEILNSFNFHLGKNAKYATIINGCKTEIEKEYNERFLLKTEPEDMILKHFQIIYYEIDVIKFFYTFNGNTKLYVFWSWVHFLQHTGVYSSLGFIVERPFINELIRIMLIVAVFDKEYFENDRLECPIPELFSYWERNYLNLKEKVNKILKLETFRKLTEALVNKFTDETTNYLVSLTTDTRTNGLLTMLSLKHTQESQNPKKKNISGFKMIDDKHQSQFISTKFHGFLENGNLNRVKLEKIWLSMEMFNYLFSNDLEEGKSLIFNKQFIDNPLAFESSNVEMMNLFFNCLSYTILTWYYEKMDHKIHLLRRDYLTGEIIMEFINANKNTFLFIDPNGDFFTPDESSRQALLKFKHAVFYSLWHLGVVYKKQLFKKEYIKQTKKK